MLPYESDELTTDLELAGLSTGHHTRRGGHDRDTQAVHHGGDFGGADVLTAARLGAALHVCDDGLTLLGELALHLDGLVLTLTCYLEGPDVALLLKDAGDLGLDAGERYGEALNAGDTGVLHAGEKICDRIT